MFSEKIHRTIFLFGLFGLAFGMMIGTVPTSVPQILLMGNWLLEGDFKRKWEQIRSNRIFWILSSVFLFHLIGLAYTSDLDKGLFDARTKMPLMFLPLIFFTAKPLASRDLHRVFYFFLTGCVVNTIWCMLYNFVIHHNELIRDVSRFMSHIRLGLYLNVAIVCCLYFFVNTLKRTEKIFFFLLGAYFILILFTLGLASGIFYFFILFFLGLAVLIYKQRPLVKIVAFLVLACLAIVVSNYFRGMVDSQLRVRDTANNKKYMSNAAGRLYVGFESLGQKENGNYVMLNIQLEELQSEWKRRFPEDSFNYDRRHNLARYEVLVRYLASKGLNKDSLGMSSLNQQDLGNIRKGVTNYLYPSWSLLDKRTYELVNEFDELFNNRYVNGHSLTMRIYFWKAAIHLIKKNFLFGVGTGDVQQELNRVYQETDSPLAKEWYKRPHNQFLTITTALGVTGLLVFLFSLFYPMITLKKHLHFIYWPFFLLALLSFIPEDTLETQAGLTFYAFFNSLFISQAWFKMRQIPGD